MNLKRKLKWIWLIFNPPKTPCPRCGSTFHVFRRIHGPKIHRCIKCFIRYDPKGNRYMWKDNES